MQIIGQVDPSLGANSFQCGIATNGGKVVLHNLSAFDLLLTFGPDVTRQAALFAWQQREFDFCGVATPYISYGPMPGVGGAPILPTNPGAAPSTFIIGEAYAPGELVPVSYPNYDRLSNLGNSQLPNITANSINNTGLPPFSPLIASTPNDQGEPSLNFTNDGSGQWEVLSAGVLRNVLSILRGTLSVEAQVVIGDPSDPTMLVMHGTADSAAQAGQATTAVTAQFAGQVNMLDGGPSTTNSVTSYEGTVDPQTYAAPNLGDLWYDG